MYIDQNIFNKNLYKVRSYVWRLEWVSQYESPWGILEKFKYANALNDNNILEIFGNENTRGKISTTWIVPERNLLTLEGLSGDRLKSILGIDLKKLNREYIDSLVGILSPEYNVNKFMKKMLNICPECMKNGYHSIFHQFKLLSKCPYHTASLIEKCPSCNNMTPYLINDTCPISSYICKCGYEYYDTKNYINSCKKWTDSRFTLKSESLLKWLNLKDDQKGLISRIYIPSKLIEIHPEIIMNSCLSLVCENNDNATSLNRLKHNILPVNKYYNNEHKNYNDFHFEDKGFNSKNYCFYKNNRMYDLYNLNYLTTYVLERLDRLLKNVAIPRPQKCISELLVNIEKYSKQKNLNICPYLSAYELWREEIEVIKQFWDKLTRNHPFAITPNTKFINNISHILYEIIAVWNLYFYYDIKYNKLKVFEWIFKNMMTCVLVDYYKACLKYVFNYLREGALETLQMNIEYIIPFFMILFPDDNSDDNNKEFRFYWIKQPDKRLNRINYHCIDDDCYRTLYND